MYTNTIKQYKSKRLRSKRRNSLCIFQMVASLGVGREIEVFF
jgi:hypothetical protein